MFGASPWLFPGHVYAGFVVATVLFSASAGLQELLLSPIIDAVPMPNKQRARAMSALHSLFAWGSIFVVLVTTLMVYARCPGRPGR